MAEDRGGSSEGPAVDSVGTPVVDPTENVKALSEAQDKLREIEVRHVREILDMRSKCAEELDDLRAALIDEKFSGEKRLSIVNESHRLELKGDSEKALGAALSAADKAVDKGLVGMKELVLNNADLAKAGIAALTDKVEDLRTTVGMLVNTKIGFQEQRTEQRTVSQEQRSISGAQLALVGLGSGILFSVISVVLTLLLR